MLMLYYTTLGWFLCEMNTTNKHFICLMFFLCLPIFSFLQNCHVLHAEVIASLSKRQQPQLWNKVEFTVLAFSFLAN